MTILRPAIRLPWPQAVRRPTTSGRTPAMILISPGVEPAMVQDRVSKDTITIEVQALPVHPTPGQPMLNTTLDQFPIQAPITYV